MTWTRDGRVQHPSLQRAARGQAGEVSHCRDARSQGSIAGATTAAPSAADCHDGGIPFTERQRRKGSACIVGRGISNGLGSASPDDRRIRLDQPDVLASNHFGNPEYSLPVHDILSFSL